MHKLVLPINYTEASVKQRRQAREQYIEEQQGLCCFCKTEFDSLPADHVLLAPIDERLFPPNFFVWPVHLHHDHNTNMTIGAVHARCNAYLWQYLGE